MAKCKDCGIHVMVLQDGRCSECSHFAYKPPPIEPKAEYPQPTSGTRASLVDKFAAIINSVSRENASDTPDFILAEYLVMCLESFETTVRAREKWYGRKVKDLNGDAP